MAAKSASRAEDDTCQDQDEEGQRCHRRKGHLAPHHASSGRVWKYWPGRRTRVRHFTDCPSRHGTCAGFHDEDGKRHQCHRRVGHRGQHHADSGLAWGQRWRRTRTRAGHYTDCPGRGGFVGVAALFLPWSWPPRLTVLAVVLWSVASLPISHVFTYILFSLGVAFVFAAGWLVTHRVKVPRGSGLFALLDAVVEGDYDDDDADNILLIMSVVVVAVFGAAAFLTFLVAGGTFKDTTRGIVWWAEQVLILVTVWLVFGVPNQAARIKLRKDGSAQRVLVGVTTAAACAVTGSYLLLLHFSGGPLRGLKPDQLVVAIVGAVVLVAPLYKSLVRALWQRGLLGSLKALFKAGSKTPIEVRAALDRPTRGKRTPCNEKIPEAEKQDQGSAVGAVTPTSPGAEATTSAPT